MLEPSTPPRQPRMSNCASGQPDETITLSPEQERAAVALFLFFCVLSAIFLVFLVVFVVLIVKKIFSSGKAKKT